MTSGRAHPSAEARSVVHSDAMIRLWKLLLPIGNLPPTGMVEHDICIAESLLKNERVENWFPNTLGSWCRAISRLVVDMWDRKNPTGGHIKYCREVWIYTLSRGEVPSMLALSMMIDRVIASTEARNNSLILLSHLWALPLVLIELQASCSPPCRW